MTDAAGAVIERLSYDAWGKRRHPGSGGDDTCSNLGGDSSEHGFTLHEHLDNGMRSTNPVLTSAFCAGGGSA